MIQNVILISRNGLTKLQEKFGYNITFGKVDLIYLL